MTWVIRRGKKNGGKKASNVVVYVQISHSLNENAFDRYLNKVVSGDLRFQVRQKKLADVQRGLLIGVRRLITVKKETVYQDLRN